MTTETRRHGGRLMSRGGKNQDISLQRTLRKNYKKYIDILSYLKMVFSVSPW